MEGELYQGTKNTAELKACVIDIIPLRDEYLLDNVEGTSKLWKATIFTHIDSLQWGRRICCQIC